MRKREALAVVPAALLGLLILRCGGDPTVLREAPNGGSGGNGGDASVAPDGEGAGGIIVIGSGGAGASCGSGQCGPGGGSGAMDGCDDTCRLEDGYACDTPGDRCKKTTCGDGKKEGSERCDDANHDLGDGCTPLCQLEPNCDQGACTSPCGDGIKFKDEACDD